MPRSFVVSTAMAYLALAFPTHQCTGFNSNSNNNIKTLKRREALDIIFCTVPFIVISNNPSPSQALDYDAFASSSITQTPSSKKLTDDEALCKFGAPGKAMGDACQRAGISRSMPGGVSPNGKVDRGDYLRCEYQYPKDANGEYVKTRVCKPSSEWGPPWQSLTKIYSVESNENEDMNIFRPCINQWSHWTLNLNTAQSENKQQIWTQL